MAIQNAKGINMPKDRVDNAIKRASSKEEKDFQEVIYEGLCPSRRAAPGRMRVRQPHPYSSQYPFTFFKKWRNDGQLRICFLYV